MSQLLQKLSITAVGKREKLLNVVKNPVTRYLPVGARKVGLSFSAEKSVNLFDYVAKSSDDEPLVFVVGAMAHGKIDKEYTDDYIQICNYPLSAACCLNRICSSLEQKWNIQWTEILKQTSVFSVASSVVFFLHLTCTAVLIHTLSSSSKHDH